MKKSNVIGLIVGLAAGAAAAAGALAVKKVSGEIKDALSEQVFTSPNGNNTVSVSSGSSGTARGLTYIRITASSLRNATCKLSMITRKASDSMSAEWIDNDHFKLTVGKGKIKQCCDVAFGERTVTAVYYPKIISR